MFFFPMNSHFLSAAIWLVASFLPPFHSLAQWKGKFYQFPIPFVSQVNMRIHAMHYSAFPSAHPGQISLTSVKMYLGQQKKSKNTHTIPPLSRGIFRALYPCVSSFSMNCCSSDFTSIRILSLHHFNLLSFPLSHQTVPLLFLLSFSEFKHNQQNPKQNKMDWTRQVRNQLHQI